MSEENKIDYSKIGFKSGLEIHQQLDSKKLFCNCPSHLRSDEPDYIITRKLHAVAGEGGEIDEAVKYQASLDKNFVYQIHKDNVCLVDLDEEPPHKINEEALKIALHIVLLLNCKIQTLTQIMRKTVIDGSNTSGFQRTLFLARDGYVETSQGRVGIAGIFLEEDSARIIGKEKGRDIYRLDRLGIPLIEIATETDIKNAEHAKETALKIGEILRSCKVKRGIGTIRQDINVSIRGHPRVEIKGFQDPKIMIKTVENEVERQLEDIKKNNLKAEVRNVLPDGKTEFSRPMPGSARMYPETDLPLLKIHKDLIDEAKRTLPKLRSEIEEELKKEGLHEEMIKLLFGENKVEEFKELLKIINKPQLIAKTLLIFPKEIATKNNLTLDEVYDKIEDSFIDILNAVRKKNISENEIKKIMEDILNGINFEDAIKIEKEDFGIVEEKIAKIINEKPGLSENAYMGIVMKEFKGKIDGKEVREIIQKFIL
ncbi:MAG: Glu-tRNA(Gln) amidotransferase subunit GatE [Candidatus Pacearchaeota archaeon]